MQDRNDELLSSRQAVELLSELWGHKVTLAAFRMLRFRRKNDPNMPKPAFADGDMVLWKRSDLYNIVPPKQKDERSESEGAATEE